jgi:hypothetical protein
MIASKPWVCWRTLLTITFNQALIFFWDFSKIIFSSDAFLIMVSIYIFLQHALQTSNYEWKYHLHKNKLFECLLIPKYFFMKLRSCILMRFLLLYDTGVSEASCLFLLLLRFEFWSNVGESWKLSKSITENIATKGCVLTGDGSQECCLPTVQGRFHDLRYITPTTMTDVINDFSVHYLDDGWPLDSPFFSFDIYNTKEI